MIWAAAADTAGPGEGLALGKLLPSGAIDSGFGTGGVRLVPGGSTGVGLGTHDRPLRLARRLDGGADLLAERYGRTFALAVRVSASGALDPSYSGDGIALLDTGSNDRLVAADVQGDQATFLQVHPSGAPTAPRLVRLTATGGPDLGVGPGGIRTTTYVPDPDPDRDRPSTLTAGPDVVVFATTRTTARPGEAPGADVELVKVSTELHGPVGAHGRPGDAGGWAGDDHVEPSGG